MATTWSKHYDNPSRIDRQPVEDPFTYSPFLLLLVAALAARFLLVRRAVPMLWVFLFAAACLLIFAALGGDDYELLLVAFVACMIMRVESRKDAPQGIDAKARVVKHASSRSPQPQSSSQDEQLNGGDEAFPPEYIDVAVSEVVEGKQSGESWQQARAVVESRNLEEVESEYVKHRVEQLREEYPMTTAERIEALEAALNPLLAEGEPILSTDKFEEKYPKKYLEVAMLEVISGKIRPESWEGARTVVEANNFEDLETEYIKLRVEQQKKAEQEEGAKAKQDPE